MDANRIPADVLGLIFSQLDLKGMVSLALTCRRFLSLFSLYSASTLFTDNWSFEYVHTFESPRNSTCQTVKAIITYTGIPPESFRREFDMANSLIKWSPANAGLNNISLALLRLQYIITFAKKFHQIPIIQMSGYLDYHVVGINVLKQPHLWHVFRLICQGKEKTYIQYHRNHQEMIVASFTTYIMTSCNFFNHQGHNMLEISLERNTTFPRYCLLRHIENGSISQSTYPFMDTYSNLDELSCFYPKELPRVFFPTYISLISREGESDVSMETIIRKYLAYYNIKELYLT